MRPAVTGYWIERRVPAMGSTATVTIGDGDAPLCDWAVDELARLEQSWSRFRPDSELTALNRRPDEWVPVSRWLLLAVSRACVLWRVTCGAFDPTVLDALEGAGYDRSFAALDRDDPRPARPPVPPRGCDGVEVDEERRAIRLEAGCRLDLGGIGKGLAADLVAQGLVDRGARSALVSLGGDIRVCGEVPEPGWPIPVEDPLRPEQVAFEHVLRTGAIVTSTTLIRTWRRGGRSHHHIVDPRTGAPTEGDAAAVVATAPAAWFAEGVAKAAVVLGRERGADLLRRSGVHGWIFGADGSATTVVAQRTRTVPCSPN